MNKIFLIFFLLLINDSYCQEREDAAMNKIYIEVFGKCFKELKSIPEAENIIPNKQFAFCSLYQCVKAIQFAENNKSIEESILKRAIEITALLYNQRTPVYLLAGSQSFYKADLNNIDITNDNNLIYISVSDCIISKPLIKIQEAINNQTTKLIKSKK